MLPMIPNKSHIEQQLTSILKQQQQQQPTEQQHHQQQPVEFIIETKIKTIDPKTGQILQTSSTDSNMMPLTSSYNQTNKKVQHSDGEGKSYFMKSFHQQQPHSPPQREKTKQKKDHQHRSSRIKIPLLNLNSSTFTDDNDASLHTPCTPLLLDFKSTSKKKKSSPPPLLNLNDGVDQMNTNKLNKHVKEFINVNKSSAIANYKQFPLLKLNFNEDVDNNRRREKDLERSSLIDEGKHS
jgi:hypothetical protein